MLDKLKSNPTLNRAAHQVKLAGKRLADQHISLAVTGLSRSGKTAFITSLVNQLLETNDRASLPFFSAVQQGRIVGVRKEAQPDVTLARFAYESAMDSLLAEPPVWPASTNGVSQVRLTIKFKNQSALRKMVSETSTLTLDITDYPGEWLLDLPLLEMDYLQWCETFWKSSQEQSRFGVSAGFREALNDLDINQEARDTELHRIASLYAEYLKQIKALGYPLIQPGRLVLPGDLKGAPVLDLFPISQQQATAIDWGNTREGSVAAVLKQRFEDYKQQIVRPFYQKHFKRFDRQIILVDCLNALNTGKQSFNELRQSINWLLGSFHYGSSNVLKRLFAPRIDKLVFAASKADHVTPEQQDNLVKLLESMVHEARQQIQFEGVDTESTAVAAVRASVVGKTSHQGKPLTCLTGKGLDGEQATLYPGDVPPTCPPEAFWAHQGFAFPNFSPPDIQPDGAVPHIRMDQILEFVLGDKLQ